MSKRRRLSRAERERLLLEQGGCCCVWGCSESENLIEEHSTPHALTGAKADQLMCKRHHDEKSFGAKHVKVDGDLSKIAKARRIANGKTQHDKRVNRGFSLIQSARKLIGRGFRTDVKRKFDGTTVKR
jgi:hypothetical protein